MSPVISNKRRILEISAVIATASGKFIFMDYLDWKFPFIVAAILGWTGYIIYRSRNAPGILSYWGFRWNNFNLVMKKMLPFAFLALCTCVIVGLARHTINYSWHIFPILILYPAWGLIQQFLLIALTAGNLHDLNGQRLTKTAVILVAAILFASVHYPLLWLVAGTFILALFYGWIYLGERNLFVLGLFHGWLGGIFYYTILGRDPFAEVFGKLFHLNS